MKTRFDIVAMIVLAVALVAACSSPKEEIQEPPPAVEPPIVTELPEATPIYKYNDRYVVPGAVITADTDFNDALQAIRVIQLRKGANNVIVISAFDKMMLDGKETPVETWLGLEMKSVNVGTYDLARDVVQVKFYRFVLADKGKRFDGQKITGTIEIKSNTNEQVSGFINARIQGETKGFNQANQDFSLSFSGSFGIDKVDLENTMMGR